MREALLEQVRRGTATPGRAAALAAALWLVAHLLVEVPRGWPFPVPGAWDVLLPATLLADGAWPERWFAGLGFGDGGTLGVVLLATGLLETGLDPVVSARLLGAAFGALAAASLGLLAWRLAEPQERGVAVVTVAAGVAVLPGWHDAIAGCHGSTPEGIAVLLAGLAAVVWERAALGGALLALAAAFSPVCAPGVLLGLVGSGRRAGWTLLGAASVAGALTLGLGRASDSTATLLGSGVDGLGPALAALPEHALRAAGAGMTDAWWALAVLTVAGLGAAGWLAVRPGWEQRWLGLGTWGFVALTLVTPEQYRHYPEAYRYWLPALLLGALCLAVAARGRAWVPLGIGALFVLGPGRAHPERVATLDEAVFAAGVHRMGAHPFADHGLLRELAPAVPEEVAGALGLGYGLLLGQQAAAGGFEAPLVMAAWEPTMADLGEAEAQGLLVGVGYGLAACPLGADQQAAIQARPQWERVWLRYGRARGLAARGAVEGAVGAELAPGETEDAVWEAIGEALRAGGRSREEVLGLEASPDAVEAMDDGFRRPGGGRWETRLMDELVVLGVECE